MTSDTDHRRRTGTVDFTMMYAAHDAFARDLRRLATAAAQDRGFAPPEVARWRGLTAQLHLHHRLEDVALWPPLRQETLTPAEIDVLDAMEREHAQIDPALDAVERAIADHDTAAYAQGVRTLGEALGVHMRHEETAALPIVEARLGPAGWAAFGAQFRGAQGVRGAAEFFPWLLDDAPPETVARVLGLLPPPVRLLYRLFWVRSYRRATRT
jgi:Hemerythrin HHE cation binding domain